jgi:hypothetical protein
MAYQSVDKLQKLLAKKVFGHAVDKKKAAGRALGTLVEIITFYLLKSWDFEHSISIERSLPEYGNSDITHNVEFALHPLLQAQTITFESEKLPLTSTKILPQIAKPIDAKLFRQLKTTLLTNSGVLRNACTIGVGDRSSLVVFLDSIKEKKVQIALSELHSKPYAIFECKRVGVEEGTRKGPQTIEKAKQGAYVARTVSSLQKVRTASGELKGLIFRGGQTIYSKPYVDLINEIVASDDPTLLTDFVLTVGVVSNHGNWFTSDNHNKELKVLAQSYDWLLFLSDDGLAEFITELLLNPVPLLKPAKDAFLASYKARKRKNRFTKVQMDYKADQVLLSYFSTNISRIETWFNIITPKHGDITQLKTELSKLRSKDWRKVHSI